MIDPKVEKFFAALENWLSILKNKYGLGTNPYQLTLCSDALDTESVHQIYRVFLGFPNHWEWRGKKQLHGCGRGLEECLANLAEVVGGHYDLPPLQVGEKPLVVFGEELRQIAKIASSSDCQLVTVSLGPNPEQFGKYVARISGDGLSDATIFLDQRLRPFVEGKGQTIVEALAQAKSLLERFLREAEERKKGFRPWLLNWKRGEEGPAANFLPYPVQEEENNK